MLLNCYLTNGNDWQLALRTVVPERHVRQAEKQDYNNKTAFQKGKKKETIEESGEEREVSKEQSEE